jgi:hypothetical protein
MKRLDFLFFYVGYPSLFSGCSGVREKSKRAVGTHHQSSRLPFLVIALVLFFSFNSVIFLLKNSRERAINILLSLLIVGSLSFSLFVALIIHYDMIGERLILFLCGKAISLFLISFCLSVYLLTTTTEFYYHSFKNLRSS